MTMPEDPPGFVVRTEAQKAAWDNGFRLERGVESGGWLRYGSTTARGEIWIAGVPPRAPWLCPLAFPAAAADSTPFVLYAELTVPGRAGLTAPARRGIPRSLPQKTSSVSKEPIPRKPGNPTRHDGMIPIHTTNL